MENNKAVNGVHAKTEPLAIYDYLKIKESAKTERVDKKLPISAFDAAHGSMTAPSRPPPPSMPPPLTPEKIAEYQKSAPPVPEWIKAQLPKGVSPEDLVWDPRFGGGFYLPPDKHPQGSRPAPQLPPRSRSSSAERPHLPRVEPLTPEMDQKIQSAIAAHQQRASPNKIPAAPQITQISPSERQQLLEENPLIKLIRGEKRPIQEELANRILSDISEEGSVTGSMASSTGPTIAEKPSPQFPRDDDASSTTTTQIEEGGEPSSGTVTPIPVGF
jgi:hypothetical protein